MKAATTVTTNGGLAKMRNTVFALVLAVAAMVMMAGCAAVPSNFSAQISYPSGDFFGPCDKVYVEWDQGDVYKVTEEEEYQLMRPLYADFEEDGAFRGATMRLYEDGTPRPADLLLESAQFGYILGSGHMTMQISFRYKKVGSPGSVHAPTMDPVEVKEIKWNTYLLDNGHCSVPPRME